MSNISWLFKMAWRDGRKNAGRLLLFSLSIVIGIAALVAIRSFGNNLHEEILRQSRALLGADLVITSTQQFTRQEEKFLDSLGKNISREIGFSSMAMFTKSGATRLCQIRAVDNKFPFYGDIISTRSDGIKALFNKNDGAAFPEELLSFQFKLRSGEKIKIGDRNFIVQGSVKEIPGQSAIASGVAPIIFIPLDQLNSTQLLQKGSRVTYKYYYKFPAGTNVDAMAEKIKPRLEKEHWRYDTVKTTQSRTSEAYEDLGQYLNLVAFVALLLGCIGVYSSVLIYIREKLSSVAILRCLGVSSNQAFGIYLIQVFTLGLAGALAGTLIGALLQLYLPSVFRDFITIDVQPNLSFPAMFQGLMAGVSMAILFALTPLLQVRRISPLNAIRSSYTAQTNSFRWEIYLVNFFVLLFIFAFAFWQTGSIFSAAIFTAGIFAAFLFLAVTGALLMNLLRRIDLSSFSFVLKQGIANLFRPDNQTIVMIISIGLGTALISTLMIVQQTLISKVSLDETGVQPNLIVFDIQPSQKEKIASLTRSQGLPVVQTVPIVTMRLESFENRTKSQVEKDSSSDIPRWVFNREYRVTFRDSLVNSEKLVKGKLYKVQPYSPDTVPISVEEGFANAIHAKLGDKLSFNVQGTMLYVKIGSVRKVDWKRLQTNFMILFPRNVLEEAPIFYVLSTKTAGKNSSANFQNKLISAFPNVSVIDLTQVLQTLKDILAKISNVIRFMAFFSIATAVIVILGSVRMSKYQRIRESVLLRTLGAARTQILGINSTEYFILGLVGTVTGIIFGITAGWAFARFLLESPLHMDASSIAALLIFVPLTTAGMGLLNVGGILRKPPLEILRNE